MVGCERGPTTTNVKIWFCFRYLLRNNVHRNTIWDLKWKATEIKKKEVRVEESGLAIFMEKKRYRQINDTFKSYWKNIEKIYGYKLFLLYLGTIFLIINLLRTIFPFSHIQFVLIKLDGSGKLTI